MKDSDVLIVGGGIIGASVAWFLSRQVGFEGRITVFERDPAYSFGATSRSVGSIRQQFSTPENLQLSEFGFRFYEELDVDDGAPSAIGFKRSGYLFLATSQGMPALEQAFAIQQRHHGFTRFLDRPDLERSYPWLRSEDLAAGVVGIDGEGWADPYAALMRLRDDARQRGVEFSHRAVSALCVEDGAAVAIETSDGSRCQAGFVVMAAGNGAMPLLSAAGLGLPIVPRKRQVFVFECRHGPRELPLLVDPGGVYVRSEGAVYICGDSFTTDDRESDDDYEVDFGFFESEVWPRLAHRVPDFEALKLTDGWVGYYDCNLFDYNVFVGHHHLCRNLILANGFSGHGFQHAPGIGRAIAELIHHGEYQSIDLGRFSSRRLETGEPVRELAII